MFLKKWVMGLVFSLPFIVHAEVVLPPIFSSNMVLQREIEVPIWGTASPDEKITVTFMTQEKSTKADSQGKWMVKLDSLTVDFLEHDLVVEGSLNTIRLTNIMIGDVWICGGQSNMQMSIDRPLHDHYDPSVVVSDFTNIRIKMTHNYQPVNQSDMVMDWHEPTPETIAYFSLVGFFFGKELNQNLGIPIGLIEAARGGTGISKWLTPEGAAEDEFFNESPEQYLLHIAPTIPFAIKGIIWYQGENDSRSAQQRRHYGRRLKTLINGWREKWGQGNFPFYSVQLPGIKRNNFDTKEVREGQRLSLSLENTGIAVTIDLSLAVHPSRIDYDLHPSNKEGISKRLALLALGEAYNQDIVHMGPMYESMSVNGNELTLKFSNTGSKLLVRDDDYSEFKIAGEDDIWQQATGRVEGDHIILSNGEVDFPTKATYAWSDYPVPSLFNEDSIAGSPFNTSSDNQLPSNVFGCGDERYKEYSKSVTVDDPTRCIELNSSSLILSADDPGN